MGDGDVVTKRCKLSLLYCLYIFLLSLLLALKKQIAILLTAYGKGHMSGNWGKALHAQSYSPSTTRNLILATSTCCLEEDPESLMR